MFDPFRISSRNLFEAKPLRLFRSQSTWGVHIPIRSRSQDLNSASQTLSFSDFVWTWPLWEMAVGNITYFPPNPPPPPQTLLFGKKNFLNYHIHPSQSLNLHLAPPFWWNPAKLIERKRPRLGREQETKLKDQSPCKQKSAKEMSHIDVMVPLTTETSTCHMKHIN